MQGLFALLYYPTREIRPALLMIEAGILHSANRGGRQQVRYAIVTVITQVSCKASKLQWATWADEGVRPTRVHQSSSSMYSVPDIAFGRYGAISLNPKRRYIATASFIIGSTVSSRIRLYPI